jgi:uncharacterized membrane protein YccC
MKNSSLLDRFRALAQQEIRHLTTFNASSRPWQLALAVALAAGIPLLIGAAFGHMEHGLVSSLGGMAMLYTPGTSLQQRMGVVMACAMGMTTCFALGLMAAFHPLLLIPVITLVTVLVTLVCRIYGVNPPGSLFFVMASAIAAYTPFSLMELPFRVGLVVLGGIVACGIAFLYSVYILRVQGTQAGVPAAVPPALEDIGPDAVIVGLAVGLSLVAAHALQMNRPYWVPVSCLAVVQGGSLRMVWNKQVQRVLGTAVGLGLAWLLLSVPMNAWQICATMIALYFTIEMLVVRHYGLAMVFITPLTLYLADVGAGTQASAEALIASRFWDIALGSAFGLLGGWFIHHRKSRGLLLRGLMALWPWGWSRVRSRAPD